MKWDIDKVLAQLEHATNPGTIVERIMVLVDNKQVLSDLGLKRPKTDKKVVFAWCLSLGMLQCRKHMVYGWTIREAFLKARRDVKLMTPEVRKFFDIPAPKKRSNSYASARRTAKPRKK